MMALRTPLANLIAAATQVIPRYILAGAGLAEALMGLLKDLRTIFLVRRGRRE